MKKIAALTILFSQILFCADDTAPKAPEDKTPLAILTRHGDIISKSVATIAEAHYGNPRYQVPLILPNASGDVILVYQFNPTPQSGPLVHASLNQAQTISALNTFMKDQQIQFFEFRRNIHDGVYRAPVPQAQEKPQAAPAKDEEKEKTVPLLASMWKGFKKGLRSPRAPQGYSSVPSVEM